MASFDIKCHEVPVFWTIIRMMDLFIKYLGGLDLFVIHSLFSDLKQGDMMKACLG